MTDTKKAVRHQKGRVAVRVSNGNLQLQFTAQGKRHYLALILKDTPANRKVAEAKAALIESDLAWDRFDPTLEKYRPQRKRQMSATASLSQVKLIDLWDEYSAFKEPQIQKTTLLVKYGWIRNRILRLPVKCQRLCSAQNIADFLITEPNSVPSKAKTILRQFSACCNWAVSEGKIPSNPFEDILKRIKGTFYYEAYDIRPFTRLERKKITIAFSKGESVEHYAGFVKFLFLTGCRPGEAIALKWKHVSDDCSQITFAESISTGMRIRKCTKTGKTRIFPSSLHLQELLQSIKPDNVNLEGSVFVSPKKTVISLGNFTRRAWQPILQKLNIPYRRIYNTRHTFITECLQTGIDVATVAKWVGNSPEVIYQHYAGANPNAVVPDVLDG